MRASLAMCSVLIAAATWPPCDVALAHDVELPSRLSDTGLFVPGAPAQIRAEVFAFSPQYPLWSDGATKRRWIYLPPGTAIDASNPGAWEFPNGTRLWKEFAHGRAIETRFIERLRDGSWRFAAYAWNSAGTDAELVSTDGMHVNRDANKRYGIPAEADCRACHEGGAVPVLGFSALQLSPDRDPHAAHGEVKRADQLDLRSLVALGLIKNLPPSYLDHSPRIQVGTPTARAALGYLHGNCGHCHNDSGSLASMELSLSQGDGSNADATLRSLVGAASRFRMHGITQRVAPGNAAASALAARMRSRNPYTQMPPLGTTVVDAEAVALIENWIEQLTTNELATQENRHEKY